MYIIKCTFLFVCVFEAAANVDMDAEQEVVCGRIYVRVYHL